MQPLLIYCCEREGMRRLNRYIRLCWRACYPILIYLLIFDLAALSGIAAGTARIGIAAGIGIVLAGPLYLREARADRKISYLKTTLSGVVFCIFGNLLIAGLQIEGSGYRPTAAVLSGGLLWQQLLVIGLLAPLAEELIFRGLVFGRLREELHFWPAAVLSALLFAGFHGNIVQGVYAFWGGLLMARSYETYHSIKAPFTIHAVSNLLSILLSVFTMGRIC